MTLEELRCKVCDYFGAYFKYRNGLDGNYLIHRGSNGRILTAILVCQCDGGGWKLDGIGDLITPHYWNDLMNLNREET